MATNVVHINWERPLNVEQVINEKTNEKKDCGIYQIYGNHPIYSSESLLYIGITTDTFSQRFSNHEQWLKDHDLQPVRIYLGDVYQQIGEDYQESEDFASVEEWEKYTKLGEQLLIYALAPGYNSRNKQSINEGDLRELHILNWGSRASLFPEVSGDRWTDMYGKE